MSRWPVLLLALLAIGLMPLRVLTWSPIAGVVAICHAVPGTPSPSGLPNDCDACPLCLAATDQHNVAPLVPAGAMIARPRATGVVAWRAPVAGILATSAPPQPSARGPPERG